MWFVLSPSMTFDIVLLNCQSHDSHIIGSCSEDGLEILLGGTPVGEKWSRN